MSFPSRIHRTVLRIFIVGTVAALAVAAVGWLLGSSRLGRTEDEAFARLEREVRARLGRTVDSLERMAATVARRPEGLSAAVDDQAAARRLFDTVDTAWRTAGGATDLAISVYGSSGQPLAWTGRPSEIDRRHLTGDQPTLFPAPEALGLRLVYVLPVEAASRRLGTVVAERLLSTRRGIVTATGDLYTLSTDWGAVSLRTRSEGAGEGNRPYSFLLRSPQGDVMLEATVNREDLARARRSWIGATVGLVLAVVAVTLLFFIGPLLDLRLTSRHQRGYTLAAIAVLGALAGSWAMLVIAGRAMAGVSPIFAPTGPATQSAAGTARAISAWLGSPFEFLLYGLTLVALVTLAFDAGERWRLRARRDRRSADGMGTRIAYIGLHLAFGVVFALLLAGYQVFLRSALAHTRLDILHFSVHPWDTARLSVAVGLALCHTAVLWLGVLLFRLASVRWRRPRDARATVLPVVAWLSAFAIVALAARASEWPVPWGAAAVAYVAVIVAGAASRGVVPRFRHASQGLRLILGFLALLVPAVVMYPTLAEFAEGANRRVIESTFAAEVMSQRETIKTHVANSLDQIDGVPNLADVVEAAAGSATPSTEAAFWIWSHTALARHRIASAVELYGTEGTLVSRFALYLPEYKSSGAQQPTREQSCAWDLYEYVSPFGAEQRKLLRAARAVCVREPGMPQRVVGSIVIHAMLDYSALPFLSSQSPYYELLRPAEQRLRRDVPGGDLDLTVYGWSRAPIYTSAPVAWPLDADLFARVYASRSPFWTRIESRDTAYNLYLMNDRGGIYALGYPTIPLVGHLVNLAELAALVGLGYLALVAGSMLFTAMTGHGLTSGRALLREIRASFYRKLFLAFVAVAVVPVITLALVAQAYIGGRLRADTEAAAVKTTAVAQRVIEDYGTVQQQDVTREHTVVDPLGTIFGDDLMVGVSRVIDQDVNMFVGPRLVATSERDLFESQLLPTRTPADVYRAIALDRRQSFVGQERTGEFTYMLAAAPVRVGVRDAILTVPMMLRQQEIERETDDMNRRLVLATLLFILLGAGIGYPMAERIADPVNRLTRATRRIARGELDARIAATSSDELRRLVEAFNSMAADLQRQRQQLERTNRLEAWAEMARQVAHEIKNPLTPIQLSAEHLQRVHSDRGRPLSPVLEECVTSILSQVRLLRQISGEFSSFASSPTARPAECSVADVIEEVVGPYRSGLAGRVALIGHVSDSLPRVLVDRVLVGRALANVIENALHAMPGTGTLTIRASEESLDGRRLVHLAVADTGIGMDAEALGRLFEPYFSTKAIGTGLGLAIAKRNLELNGGTITVESEKGRGTTVHMRLPVAG